MLIRFACPLAVMFLAGSASAATLTTGDVVVAVGFGSQATTKFAEYTPAGALVQSYSISVPAGTSNVISGIAVGPNSVPYVYVGNFKPVLWTVNPATGTMSTETVSGWANNGSVAEGGLAAAGNYIYATSENNADSTGGVFRFDLGGGPTQHFFDPNPVAPYGNTSYDKVTVGYNGQFYGILNNGGYTSPYIVTANPVTGAGFTPVTLFESVNAIAVDAAGDLYVLRGGVTGEGIDELSPSFTLLRSLNFPDNTLGSFPDNLELSVAGNILATSSSGVVLQTTTALNSYSTFSVGGLAPTNTSVTYTDAAFVQPPAPVPEPTSLCLGFGVGADLLPPSEALNSEA